MSLNQIRARIGIFLLVAHATMMALLLFFYFFGGFTFPEFMDSIGLIGPIFAAFTTIIVRWYLKNSHTIDNSEAVSRPYIFITIGLPSFFVSFIILLIWAKAYNFGIESFANFKTILALGETGFAVSLGFLVESLFTENN